MTNNRFLLMFLGIALVGTLTIGCSGEQSDFSNNDSNSFPPDDSDSAQANEPAPISQQTRVVLVEAFTRDG